MLVEVVEDLQELLELLLIGCWKPELVEEAVEARLLLEVAALVDLRSDKTELLELVA
jgi:hypothetical protein